MTTDDKTPVEYKPGGAQKGDTALTDHYKFNLNQMKFLASYAKTLDMRTSAKEVGVSYNTVNNNWIRTDKFRAEIEKIHEVWSHNIRMTSEHATAKHIELMDKMEKHLDEASDTDTAAKVMNPLARMSDTYLKATGKFNQDRDQSGLSVTINITKSEDYGIQVDGEVIENEEE